MVTVGGFRKDEHQEALSLLPESNTFLDLFQAFPPIGEWRQARIQRRGLLPRNGSNTPRSHETQALYCQLYGENSGSSSVPVLHSR